MQNKGVLDNYQLPHSAMTLTLGRRVGSKARNCNSDLERTCAKKERYVCRRVVRFSCSLYTEVLVNHDYLGFNYPDHKSFGIRRQCSEPVINLWWEIPPYNGLFP